MNEHKSYNGATRRFVSGPAASRRRSSKTQSILASLLAVIVVAFVVVTFFMQAREAGRPLQKSVPAAKAQLGQPIELANLPSPDLLRPLTATEAVVANASKPVLSRPDDPPAVFKLSGDAASKGRALECLTQAVYYEAASEGAEGGRAVAQIVLNRVRHPGYPSSVCGVVFENSERTTGCQFSFTCDGSLSRVPVAYIWARSRVIANEALSGRVFAAVGHATHYHADYVLPYWADSLDKVAVIGRHIFYRLRGDSGSRRSFSQRYRANEPMPPSLLLSYMMKQVLNGQPESSATAALEALPRVEEDRVRALERVSRVEGQTKLPLAADSARGQLILGDRSSTKSKIKSPEECGAVGVSRINPIAAEDLKAGAPKQVC